MRSLKIILSYDGTAYAGWQVQPGQDTIQRRLEQALSSVTGEQVRCIASGRTDAGVHAMGQVISCAVESALDVKTLHRAINASLPQDIVVQSVCQAPEEFHAIRDAQSKRYRYLIDDGPLPDVFLRHYAWWPRWRPLDLDAMCEAAGLLVGQHDFASFEAAGSERATTIRTVSVLDVRRRRIGQTSLLAIDVCADGFLYNMVRNIVGTLVEVGRGAQPVSWVRDVLAACDRTCAGPTAPPHGLFLVEVTYDVTPL